ncbi:MAG: paraquat-inducible protein A [Comamonas sp.]
MPRFPAPAPTAAHVAVCEHCDQCCAVPPLARGQVARCPRCQLALDRHERLGPREMLAICLTAVVAFVLANAYPLVTLEVQGMARQASLLQAIAVTWQQPGLWGVALMALLTAFVLPLAQLLLLLGLLLMLMRQRVPPGFEVATRWLRGFRPWSMVPVFVLGVLVAIIKMADMATIIVGVGLWSMAALVLLLTLLARLDARTLWRYAEETGAAHANPRRLTAGQHGHRLLACEVCGFVHDLDAADGPGPGPGAAGQGRALRCARCGSRMHRRKPDSLARTWAFLLTGLLLYLPANLLPIMRTTGLLDDSQHTILGGVVELWRGGAPDIAIVVFVASIAVPLVKFVVLVMLLLAVQGSQRGLDAAAAPATGVRRLWAFALGRSAAADPARDRLARARLYRFVEFIGQWSMLDVFVVLLLAALVNFQGLMQVSAGFGALAFGLTVAATMVAAMSFDPRLIWDAPPLSPGCGPTPTPNTTPGEEVHARAG